jgi:hypothetical protein
LSTDLAGGPQNRATDPEVRAAKRRLYLQSCRAYLIYGLVWSGVGAYIIVMPIPRSANSTETLMRLAGVFTLTFGLVRVFNALYRLRQLRRFDRRGQGDDKQAEVG